MESIIPMTAGLLLDICGSFLIAKLFLSNIRNSRFFMDSKGRTVQMAMSNFENDYAENKRQNQAVVDAKYGFTFLACGFFLILIASWITYLNLSFFITTHVSGFTK